MNSVSIPSRPEARARSASAATSALLPRSLNAVVLSLSARYSWRSSQTVHAPMMTMSAKPMPMMLGLKTIAMTATITSAADGDRDEQLLEIHEVSTVGSVGRTEVEAEQQLVERRRLAGGSEAERAGELGAHLGGRLAGRDAVGERHGAVALGEPRAVGPSTSGTCA